MILQPKLLTTLKDYTRQQFLTDVLAGVIVGIVAIPLALAFAIASGVSPEKGLFTVAVAGLLISTLGGSRVQIGGPTGAFVVIVYDIVQKYGPDGLALCTIMAGFILLIMGFAKLGAMVKFIPYPVVTGFTSGIAMIIFSSQIKDLLGLKMSAVPVDFFSKWTSYFSAINTISWPAFGISLFTLSVLWLWPKFERRIPSPAIALVTATVLAQVLGLPIETIGSKFGHLPHTLPTPQWPHWQFQQLPQLIRPALTVALLAAIESLLSAVVADGMIGGRHRSNMELIAQGLANIASPIFGGIPATGAIARTATNIKCGGRTPIAGITHALVVLLILFVASQWVEKIPLCVLASILVIVSYNMSEWRSFAALLKGPRSDAAVLLTTFVLTVLVDLTVAVEVGLVLASFLFIRRMAEVTEIEEISLELNDDSSKELPLKENYPGIEIYDINGPFFFGAADKLRDTLNQIHRTPDTFILRLHNVPALDATGLRVLEDFQSQCSRRNTRLILLGLRRQPLKVLQDTGAEKRFDHVLIENNLQEAIKLATRLSRSK